MSEHKERQKRHGEVILVTMNSVVMFLRVHDRSGGKNDFL